MHRPAPLARAAAPPQRHAPRAWRPDAPRASAAAAVALAEVDAVLWQLHTHRGQPGTELAALLAREPGHVPAHRLRTGLIVAADQAAARADLAASLAVLQAAPADPQHPDGRHAAAAQAWLQGDAALALERYGAIVVDHPTDLLALVVAHALDFRLGRRRMLRDRIAQVLPAWRAGMPGHASVLAMHAFGLAENGQLRQAEKVARRALAIDIDHPGAVHVVAHVMEMQGRAREGLDFLARHEAALQAPTDFAVHLQWHRALCHFELDDTAAALRVCDERILGVPARGLSPLADAAALLWRLMLRGVDVSSRWAVLARRWEQQAFDAAGSFIALHALLAFAAAGRPDAAQRVLAALRSDAAQAWHPGPAWAGPVGHGLVAFAQGRYAEGIAALDAVRDVAHQCGGSLAQCDIVHLTHTEAALRAGRTALAQALVAERAAQRPASRINRWLQARIPDFARP